MNDIEVLRRLGSIYSEYALSSVNEERQKLHIAVNDLHQIRPILLIDEFPWHEINIDGFLDLQCKDEKNRQVEMRLRRNILKRRHFGGDMILEPYIGIEKIIEGDFIGVQAVVERLSSDPNNNVSAIHYENQFESEEDLKKLHNVNLKYLEKETNDLYEHFSEIFKGVVPVKIVGHPTGYQISNKTWDIISHYMGVNDLLYNMIDEPEFMHKLVRVLTDIFEDRMKQYEELNLLDADSISCQGTSTLSEDLKKNPIIDGKITCNNVWGRGLAQILTSVSPEMHDEFDIKYMIDSLAPFGLVYYGCCEALDTKIDILRQIKNLRKISISPWANMQNAAEQIGKDYVISAKPNPAIIGASTLDLAQARAEIQGMLDAANANGCSLEIVMKDISTVSYNPQNLIQWEELVMSMIN